MKYVQCNLQKGFEEITSWIPKKFAKKGRYLKIKDNDGWLVKSVGAVEMEEESVRDRSQDYKKTRIASDI